eukprot:Amastigsp_a842721_26.p2 type:complete len:173 gc:universal Amastigsp_a842721_26:224-742(+)
MYRSRKRSFRPSTLGRSSPRRSSSTPQPRTAKTRLSTWRRQAQSSSRQSSLGSRPETDTCSPGSTCIVSRSTRSSWPAACRSLAARSYRSRHTFSTRATHRASTALSLRTTTARRRSQSGCSLRARLSSPSRDHSSPSLPSSSRSRMGSRTRICRWSSSPSAAPRSVCTTNR